jgi:hypothetical protein
VNRKKLIESRTLTDFLKNHTIAHNITAFQASETPDFICEANDKRISIEITGLIDPVRRKIEALQDKIIDDARKRFQSKYNENIVANITFTNQPLRHGLVDLEKYSKELSDEVEKAYLDHRTAPFHVTVKCEPPTSWFIEKISINNKLSYSAWQRLGISRHDWVSQDWLISAIIAKESNLKRYRNKFDENWLILTSNHGTKSSAHRFDFMNFDNIKSDFERIFIYEKMEDEIIVIK